MSTIKPVSEETYVAWIASVMNQSVRLAVLPRQASKRQYCRVFSDQSAYIFMDSSLEPQTARDFVKHQHFFDALGLRVPAIIAADHTEGYLIVEDFGQVRLLEYLIENPELADTWYKEAMGLIHRLHDSPSATHTHITVADAQVMMTESMRCVTEFLPTLPTAAQQAVDVGALHVGIAVLVRYLDALPKYLAHGDFHAANLMCLDNSDLGVLDFQSPVMAPAPYDLVSLLRDCYIGWPVDQVDHWVRTFYSGSTALQRDFKDSEAFLEAFDAAGLQRHLKCLGLFRHLADNGQTDYANHLVPVMRYILMVCNRRPQWQVFEPLIKQGLLCYR